MDWATYFENKPSLQTLVPLLPVALAFKGKPFSLKDHFVFEPLFAATLPTELTIKASRQVGKSASISALNVFNAAARPHYKALYVTPLYEQCLKFSNDYAREFIEDSPIRSLLRADQRSGSVLRRAFKNRAILYFSYAYESAERIRGISLAPFGRVNIDEAQDMNPDFFPVIGETMSACDFPSTIYSGTSKAKAGPLEAQWLQSSMAEWVTRCEGCNHDNIASIEHDLIKMIGPYHDDISRERPATICARCGRPIFPRNGRWEHRRPDYRMTHAGYHIPQILLPLHNERPNKWQILLGKQRGQQGYTPTKFKNEVLGEADDTDVGLVSETDLRRAAVLHPNNEETAVRLVGNYLYRVLGVDWGGGGEKGISLTALAVLGIRPDGLIDVLFGKKLYGTTHNHDVEARECLRVFARFSCAMMAHDFTGAGDLRETVMVHNGMPYDRLMPIQYAGPAMGAVLNPVAPTPGNPRRRWTANKTRTLQLTCYALRFGKIRTFAYDKVSPQEPGLLCDFLALIENKVPRPGASDAYTIFRSPHLSDDFAQAVNLGALALWQLTGTWPNFTGQGVAHMPEVAILSE